jgi:hypothetical protein
MVKVAARNYEAALGRSSANLRVVSTIVRVVALSGRSPARSLRIFRCGGWRLFGVAIREPALFVGDLPQEALVCVARHAGQEEKIDNEPCEYRQEDAEMETAMTQYEDGEKQEAGQQSLDIAGTAIAQIAPM